VERKGDQARVAAHNRLDFVLADLSKIIDKGDATARARQISGDEKAAIKIRTLPFHGRLWGRHIWGGDEAVCLPPWLRIQ
jgi:hypothetical protein